VARSASAYQLSCRASIQALNDLWAQKLNDAMAADRATFVDVTNDLQNNALQATLVVDRDKAAIRSVSIRRHPALERYGGFGTATGLDDLRPARQL
jgi:HAE1 family hydrophobic/amphiphilic exporter-1